jgi:dihydroorotate dehydrogenase electron transfer subunit
MIHCGEKETVLPRPLSIFGVSHDRRKVELLFSIKGIGTSWLAERKVGEQVKLLGPLGNGFKIEPGWRDILLLAGGLGIAPLTFLAKEQAGRRKVTLAFGTSSSTELIAIPDLPKNVTYLTATEDGSAGSKGLVTALAKELIHDSTDAVLCCGPHGMLQALSKASWLSDKHVQVSLEVRMGCGTGLCFGCTISTSEGPKRVCRDGPVFPLVNVHWDSVRI